MESGRGWKWGNEMEGLCRKGWMDGGVGSVTGWMGGWKDGCGEKEGSGQKMADRGVGGRIIERWMANNG